MREGKISRECGRHLKYREIFEKILRPKNRMNALGARVELKMFHVEQFVYTIYVIPDAARF